MTMLTKCSEVPLDIKDISDDGIIEGVAAAYDNLDFGGDIIRPGAFTKTIKGRRSLPMLLFHDKQRPIGVWSEFIDTPKGLNVRGKISVATTVGAEAWTLAKDGALSGLSIGYQVVKQRYTDKARELFEVVLHETSLVAIPMNERTVVTGVKDIIAAGELPTEREFEAFLRDAGGFSRSFAKALAGKAAPLLRREAGSEVNDQLQRFAAAMGL